MSFIMPTRTLDYLLMGIVAGIVAGIILVYIGGITYFSLMGAGESLKASFKMP